MNLLKSFKTTTGLEPGKAHIYEKIFPLPFNDYIILETQSIDANKNYCFWSRIIELIRPILAEKNINIIHFIDDKRYHFDDVYIENLPACSEPSYPTVTLGSITTPLPITGITFGLKIPEGNKCNAYF